MAEAVDEVHSSDSTLGDLVEDTIPLPITLMIEQFPLQNLDDFERLETILHDGRCRKRLRQFLRTEFAEETCGENFVLSMLDHVLSYRIKVIIDMDEPSPVTELTLFSSKFFQVLSRALLQKFPEEALKKPK